MRDQNDNRTPDEIERDIERTRADFSSTIDAIQNKLRPSHLVDQAVDYALATPPGVFSANLVHSVRDNPMPAALIGIGIAWLMAANKGFGAGHVRHRNERVVRHTVYYPDGRVMHYNEVPQVGHHAIQTHTGDGEGMMHRVAARASDAGHGIKDRASDVGQGIKDRASDAGHGIKDRARDAGHGIKDRARDVGQRLSDSASSVSDRAHRMTESAQARLHETAEQAQARISDMGHRSQAQYYRARNRFGQLLDEQPLVVGALGIAIGSALGATMPSTRRENELMGRTRDNLVDRARETAAEQAEIVKQSARRVAEVAKDEAGNVVQAAKEEAGRVKEESSSAVHDQMKAATDRGTEHSPGPGSSRSEQKRSF